MGSPCRERLFVVDMSCVGFCYSIREGGVRVPFPGTGTGQADGAVSCVVPVQSGDDYPKGAHADEVGFQLGDHGATMARPHGILSPRPVSDTGYTRVYPGSSKLWTFAVFVAEVALSDRDSF